MRTEILRIFFCFFYQTILAIQMSDMCGLRRAQNIGDNVYGNGSGNRQTDNVYSNGSGDRQINNVYGYGSSNRQTERSPMLDKTQRQ